MNLFNNKLQINESGDIISKDGSLKLGNHVLSEETGDNDDGFAITGSLHIGRYAGGKAGNICIHEGAEPVVNESGIGHRIWVDESHNIHWQSHLGVSKIIHTENGDIIANTITVNSIEIVGSDGEVNKAAIEDSGNWDTAYGWGDHSLAGYLTLETDPVFSAWDKSIGISITESQISDLSHFSNSDAIAAIEGEATLRFQQPTTISTKTGGGVLTLKSEGNSLILDAGIDIRLKQDVLLFDNKSLWIGTSKDYWLEYSTSGSRLILKSRNIDGVPTEGIILRIQDGTQDVEFLGAVKTDTINEFTADAGVTVDSVLLKDGTVNGYDISGLQAALDLRAPLASPVFTGNITMPGTGIWNSSGWVGVGTITPGLPLEVRNADDNLALFFDSRAQAQGVGGGIAFGGKYTDAGAEAMTGRIGTQKANSTSGHIGFDMVIETQDAVGSMTERAIFTFDGKFGLGITPTRELDVNGSARIINNLLVSGTTSLTGDLTSDANLLSVGIETSGNIGAGKSSPNFRIDAYINRTTGLVRSGRFQVDGNNTGARGLYVIAGEDSESGTNYWFEAYDGDGGTNTGGLRSVAGVFDVYNASDRRLKKNINNTKLVGKDVISRLKIRDFEYKKNPGRKITGLVAQEVREIYPAAVGDPDPATGMYGISNTALLPPLIKYVQELEKRITELEST